MASGLPWNTWAKTASISLSIRSAERRTSLPWISERRPPILSGSEPPRSSTRELVRRADSASSTSALR
ncbi:MAG: hypothetical protein ACXVRH_03875 [Thermoleophilaceae bacterium]